MSSKINLTSGQIKDFVHPGSYWLQRAQQNDRQGNLLRAAVLMRHGLEQEDCGAGAELQYAWLLRRLGCISASLRESLYVLAAHPAQFTAYGLVALNMTDLGQKISAMDAHMIYSQFVDMFPFAAPEWDEETGDMEEWMYAVPSEEFHYARSAHNLKMAWKKLDEGETADVEKYLDKVSPRYRALERRVLEACLSPEKEICFELLRSVGDRKIRHNPMLLLRCAEAAGRFSKRKAVRWLMKAACVAKTPAELGYLCEMAERLGAWHIANSALKAALLDCPTRLDALFDLCVHALKNGDFAEAKRLAYRVYLLDPEDPSVEKLWEVSLRLGDMEPPAPETLRNICQQPFYARRDTALEEKSRKWLKNSSGKTESIPVRKARIYMQYLLGEVLSPAECIGLLRSMLKRDKSRQTEAMIRGYMLSDPGSYGLRQASRLMLLLSKPPYMAYQDGHYRLYHPSAMNTRMEGFYQRRVFQTLCILKKKLGRDALPLALTLLNRMPAADRAGFLGQERYVWVYAFCAEYARFTGRLIRPLDPLLLYPTRKKQWINACHALRTTMNSLKVSTQGKEPSHDETH